MPIFLSFIVFSIALLTLAEYVSGRNLGIDELLFRDVAGLVKSPFPGRMSPITAGNFLLLACGMVLLGFERLTHRHVWTQALALVAGVLTLMVLMGYVYSVRSLYGLSSHTQVALHTAIGFALLAAGILFVSPEQGLMALGVSGGAGGRLLRRLIPAAIVIPPLIGWLRLQGQRAGWYGTEFGLALFAASNVCFFTCLIWLYARSAEAADLERTQAEERLRAQKESFHHLFANNPLPMWVWDQETTRFLEVNEAAVAHYGYSRDEFLNMVLADVRHSEDAAGSKSRMAEHPPAPVTQDESRHRRKDRRIIEVKTTSHVLEFTGHKAVLEMSEDITERKRLEQQFLQAQKLEAVGRLAGGVAHDFNNCLTVILGYCALVLERAGADHPLRESLEMIHDAGERAAAVTRQLLSFSRKQVFQPRILDLSRTVSAMLKMLQSLIGEDVEVVQRLAPDLWQIQADPAQIDQILMNLAVNARDAMPKGGKLVVETANVELDHMYAQGHLPVRPGPHVMLAVTDTGTGMDKETQSKIFEPFFTTKEKGKGTGLGLATVYGIVKQSGGYIWVYSELGRGTTFKVYFRRAEEKSAEPIKVQRPARPIFTESQTVLVVEDDESLQKLSCQFLQSSGFAVLQASNGAEALQIASLHPGPIHLLITDTVMPGLSGSELVRRLQAQRPETKVLYVSGYADDTVMTHGISSQGEAFLQKPFSKTELINKVVQLLEG